METVVTEALGHAPQALLDRPELYIDLEEEKSAYYAVSGERTVYSNGVGPVKISAIILYATAMRIDDVERFIRLMQAADTAYLEHYDGHNATRKT